MKPTLLKQVTKMVAVALLLLSTVQLSAQTTEEHGNNDGKGYGIRAKSGAGKYRSAIYWLSFGRAKGQPIQDGDKATFITPSKTKYTVEIQEIKGYDRLSNSTNINGAPYGSYNDPNFFKYSSTPKSGYLLAGNPDNSYAGNNFPSAYSFNNNANDETQKEIDGSGNITKVINHHNVKNIMLNAKRGKKVTFKLIVTAVDRMGNTVTNNNIILAGTESLGGPHESYGMRFVSKPGEKASVKILEAYRLKGEWEDPFGKRVNGSWVPVTKQPKPFDLLVKQQTIKDENGNDMVELKATSPTYGYDTNDFGGGNDGEGDVMFAAAGVTEIYGMVEGGGQQSQGKIILFY